MNKLKKKAAAKYESDQAFMDNTAAEMIKRRREHPTEKKDLLNFMTSGTDLQSGDTMRDDLIITNIITF